MPTIRLTQRSASRRLWLSLAVALLFGCFSTVVEAARNPIRSCQNAIDDVGAGLLEKAVRFQQLCLHRKDVGKLPPDTVCLLDGGSVAAITDAKTRTAILTASAKARDILEDRCIGVDLLAPAPEGLGFAGSCPSVNGACSAALVDGTDVIECLVCTHLATAQQAIVLERPNLRSGSPQSNLCPVALEVTGNAGSSKILDIGWTGLGHNATVVSDGTLTFDVDCAATTRPCGVCNVSGPIENLHPNAGDIDSHRCSNDSSIKCKDNTACAIGTTCVFYFGAPLPLSAGGIGTCVVNQIEGSATGTTNIETGAFASTINLRSRIHTLTNADVPCPRCDGDGVPNDGVAGGTCVGGTRNGQACDVNGTSPIPSFGKTSLDCPPAGPISALSIALDGSSGIETQTLSASSPTCNGTIGGNKKCFCPAAGSQPTQPSSCIEDTSTLEDESICAPISPGSNKGQCPISDGRADRVCFPLETFRGCLGNSDCPAPGDTCAVLSRPCYLDNGVIGGSVTAKGVTDPSDGNGIAHPTFAALFCVPPTASPAANAANGLPGLGRLELPLVIKQIVSLP